MTPDAPERPRAAPDRVPADAASPRRLDAHLLEYVRDPALWPVLVVALAIFVTLGTALLLAALRLRNVFALAALAVLAVASGDVLWRDLRRHRVGAASRAVLALWLLSLLASAFAVGRGWA